MKLPILTALSLGVVTFGASAQSSYLPTQHQPSFDFVQAAYQSYSLDGFESDFDGFSLQGNFSLTEQLFVDVHYEDISAGYSVSYTDGGGPTDFPLDFDLRQVYANIGYQFYQHGSTALYATAGIAWAESKTSGQYPGGNIGGSESDTGYNVAVGVRHRLTEQVEFDASLRHVDVFDDSDQILTLAGRFYVTDRFSLDARYTRVDSDFSGYGVGASFHF